MPFSDGSPSLSPRPAGHAALADPRMCVLLTALLGLMVWRAKLPAVLVFLALVATAFAIGNLTRRMEPGSLGRTLRFAAFWAGIKLFFDIANLLWRLWPQLAAAGLPHAFPLLAAGLPPPLEDALLLFLRLLTLMAAALALALHLSPRSLALAVTWFLRPLAGKNAWKPALALALMAQYLPRIHHISAQTRLAARSRGLPDSGLAYWRIALPQVIRLLSQSAWGRAVGIVSRGLDCPEAWSENAPLPPAAFAAAGLMAAGIVFLACL